MPGSTFIVDANEAVASAAYRTNEVIAIYPITPASPMGEHADAWAARGRPNLWGAVPKVSELQSEGGAAGAVHGALQAGALTTTFTASQGLLLMLPTMFKIAGELNSFVMHVAARSVATHALSIFGDHSDVMACRGAGFAMLCSGSVQEAHDFAQVAQMAALEGRIPVLHFFDGFRTSHEIQKIVRLGDEDLKALTDQELIAAHRRRALTPDRPVVRGTAQNPDVFFQAREACNPFYTRGPQVFEQAFSRFAERTGRRYRLFDWVGHPEAERAVVLMGSGAETAHETVEWLASRGEKVGCLKVRLFRPFDAGALAAALPPSVQALAVLDRTKEPGAPGEPLYQDVLTGLAELAASGRLPQSRMPRVTGGRYGLSSKELTPAMLKTVLDSLVAGSPPNHFTVGITDDVEHHSLEHDRDLDIEPEDVVRAVFFGLGSDGTVGANKNSIKIIGEGTDNQVQGYFVYDSKKSGAMTVSHLRFGPRPIRSSYLINRAHFVACHHRPFLDKLDVLGHARPGGTFLLNTSRGPGEVWDHLPRPVQEQILEKKLRFHVIDGHAVAEKAGLGRRINTVMQTCFFALSGVLPKDEAMTAIKEAVRKSYAGKGSDLVERNEKAVVEALAHLHEVEVPSRATSELQVTPIDAAAAPDFVQRVTATILGGKGDLLPVSSFPVDGTWPLGTSRYEKRNIAQEVPLWEPDICIQCNKCALACPHASIRPAVANEAALEGAPATFRWTERKDRNGHAATAYVLQVAPEDCTGCRVCVMVCPAKDRSNPRRKAINMVDKGSVLEAEKANFDFFLGLEPPDRAEVKQDVKGSQLLDPLFEFSGACAGCGETPYIKLLTQLFGDRLLIANATGCSSIYGGNLPTTPYSAGSDGRGPAWSNSLFENNAEFGYGMRLALDAHRDQARGLLEGLAQEVDGGLARSLLEESGIDEAAVARQRGWVEELKQALRGLHAPEAGRLLELADYLVRKSVWIVGGDGWAYDIGYGGLDHVLASGQDVNVLVLDTEVYSNTGGQQSKATPMGAAAKFAASGKSLPKKDLGMMAMTYGHVYVASVAFGAKDAQLLRALQEADAHPGPSLVIAFSHCIAHGYDMAYGPHQQKMAVDSGVWPLYRFDPGRLAQGEPPLALDVRKVKADPRTYMLEEARFRMVERSDPTRFRELIARAGSWARERRQLYEQLSRVAVSRDNGNGPAPER